MRTADGFRTGDRIVRRFPAKQPTEGTVTDVIGEDILVSWDRGGPDQLLPPEQRSCVELVPAEDGE